MEASQAQDTVAVIGGGVMGLCTAVELSEQGRSVELFERSTIANNRGGSGGVGRIFRLTYPEPEMVGLLAETIPLWDRLEGLLGQRLRSPTGGIDYGDDAATERFAKELAACSRDYRWIDDSEAAATWPDLELDSRVLWQPDAAVIHSERVLSASVNLLRERGVTVHEDKCVDGLELTGAGVKLMIADQARDFSQVVVCAGGFTNELCGRFFDLPPIRITQEFTLSFDCDPQRDPFPIACDYRTPAIPGESYFWLPSEPGRMKVGAFATGATIELSQAGEDKCPPDLEEVLCNYASATFAGGGPLMNAELVPCTYDFSPDEWFYARTAADGRVIAAGGFSGHGFKLAPYVAVCLARAIDSRGAEMPAGLPWSLA